MRIVVLLLIGCRVLFAAPSAFLFDTLVEPLQKSTASIEKLSQKSVMEPNKQILRNFLNGVEATLSVGKELSTANKVDNELLNAYLKELRELSRTKESIDALYRKSLNAAIAQSDKKSFEDLISVPLDPLHHPRIRSEVIAFYQKNYPHHSIKSIDALCEEQTLEQKSIQIAIEQEQAYEEHLRILKRSEVSSIKKIAQIGSRNSVILSSESNGAGGYEFEAENLNPYTVTMSIDFEYLNNLKPSVKIPLFANSSHKCNTYAF